MGPSGPSAKSPPGPRWDVDSLNQKLGNLGLGRFFFVVRSVFVDFFLGGVVGQLG